MLRVWGRRSSFNIRKVMWLITSWGSGSPISIFNQIGIAAE